MAVTVITVIHHLSRQEYKHKKILNNYILSRRATELSTEIHLQAGLLICVVHKLGGWGWQNAREINRGQNAHAYTCYHATFLQHPVTRATTLLAEQVFF